MIKFVKEDERAFRQLIQRWRRITDYGIFVLQRGDGYASDRSKTYFDKYGLLTHSEIKSTNSEIPFTIDII